MACFVSGLVPVDVAGTKRSEKVMGIEREGMVRDGTDGLDAEADIASFALKSYS